MPCYRSRLGLSASPSPLRAVTGKQHWQQQASKAEGHISFVPGHATVSKVAPFFLTPQVSNLPFTFLSVRSPASTLWKPRQLSLVALACLFPNISPVFFLHHRVCSATVWQRSIFWNETGGESVRGVMMGWRVKGGAGFRKALLCGRPCQIDWWERQACVLGSPGIHPPGWADTLI